LSREKRLGAKPKVLLSTAGGYLETAPACTCTKPEIFGLLLSSRSAITFHNYALVVFATSSQNVVAQSRHHGF